MIPKIKKTNNLLQFDAKLSQEEQSHLKELIQSKITYFAFENCQVDIEPKLHLSCYEKFAVRFQINNHKRCDVVFTSLLKERHLPITPQGALLIQFYFLENNQSSLILPKPTLDKSFSTNINYPENTPINKIEFYGSSFSGKIKAYDLSLDNEFLLDFGLMDSASLELESIDFFIFHHKNNRKTIVSLDQNGFWINIATENELNDDLINSSYLQYNGFKKKIKLQHSIQ